ncbi:unnamed protein product [Penicillium roqueforti FM164]|uniref:Str. FM013 n=2 Tax=Penicillium TaxID=5073 RepID=A0A0G4PYD1_PENC3|nr:unnamed protein product [Penicillium roqueforti FM164]CRL31508.1 unnamed protein product [Penicillium camemberti]
MAHELGFRDRHSLARLQRYYHTLARTWTEVRFCDADLSDDPRDSRSRRFYLWPGEKLERIAKVQT